jgi:hypothetical protein
MEVHIEDKRVPKGLMGKEAGIDSGINDPQSKTAQA